MGIEDLIRKSSADKHKQNLEEVKREYQRAGSGQPLEPGVDFKDIMKNRSPDTVKACKSLSSKGYKDYIAAFNAMIGGSSITMKDVAAVLFYLDNKPVSAGHVCFITYHKISSFESSNASESCLVSDHIAAVTGKKTLDYEGVLSVLESLFAEAKDPEINPSRKKAIVGAGDNLGYIKNLEIALQQYREDRSGLSMHQYTLCIPDYRKKET